VGWMTTVENRIGSQIETSHMTTEGPARIADALARHQQSGGTDMILEISSHAIDQHRVAGVPMVAGAITSLGRDHLDYHKTLENYHATKLKLRKLCISDGPFLTPLNQENPDQVGFLVSRSSSGNQQVTAEILESSFAGTRARIRSVHFETEIQIPQPGIHNLSNALCAIALADACHFSEAVITAGIENATGVPGRLEPIVGSIGQIFIDFAHTPDAIEAVLQTIKPLVRGQLLVLFGCGGDRDRGKRPEMGAAVARYADRIIVTSDNPRSESPGEIIEQVLAGIPQVSDRVVQEPDRRLAISKALEMMNPDDVLIIAGKGHEKTQEIAGVKSPFCDVEVVKEFLGLDSVSTEIGEELIP
ncbi:MAG: UDP-N-acetylmuramoyl-L-alanyl-D-glutamate--2,6-diaminopimelate ligase, partial [Planctomycetota bacterium]